MRVSEINKEIEKKKKGFKKVGIFLVVEFVVLELCILGVGYKFKNYDGLGFIMLLVLVIMGVGIPMGYKADQKELKTLIEKRTKLEQDEQFIKRRVGIYEAADDEQKKQLSRAYFDVNTAYKANFIGGDGFSLLNTNKDADEEKSQFYSLWNRRNSSRRHSTWICCPS